MTAARRTFQAPRGSQQIVRQVDIPQPAAAPQVLRILQPGRGIWESGEHDARGQQRFQLHGVLHAACSHLCSHMCFRPAEQHLNHALFSHFVPRHCVAAVARRGAVTIARRTWMRLQLASSHCRLMRPSMPARLTTALRLMLKWTSVCGSACRCHCNGHRCSA